MPQTQHVRAFGLFAALSCAFAGAAEPTWYATKTPYRPQQDPATYEAPPPGYKAVFTQLVARHGSRGLTGVKADMTVLNMWKRAKQDNALTPLGEQLGPDVEKLMRATALMGYGADNIGSPGYGNLSRRGVEEHQQLARRMRARLATLFDDAVAGKRRIVVVSSGVGRARDSAINFTRALVAGSPALEALATNPPATDRYMLYFHALKPAKDAVAAGDPRYQVYQDSLAYQAYEESPDYKAKIAMTEQDAPGRAAARAVLEGLFSKAFVDKIDSRAVTFDNGGSIEVVSDDGKYRTTVQGNGKSRIEGVSAAADALYALYIIMPGMRSDLDLDFNKYIDPEQARRFAYLQDLEAFYKQGPSFIESNGVTWKMAQGLEDDFFNEVDAIEQGKLAHAAKLRFAHAEIIIPFASKLGLAHALLPLPKAQLYTWENSAWRGENVAPMAANVQWDVVRNEAGKVLVKMLYNEKETPFKPACESARFKPASFYYDYAKLKVCYGHAAAPSRERDK